MRSLWTSFSLAWHLLTIIPLSGGSGAKVPSETFGASLRWFPLIGFLLGASMVMVDRLLESVFPPVVLNMVMLTLYVLITGGLHLDGWADTVDALSGGKDPDHRLMILRDSRIGALGATGLLLILGLRYAGLLALPGGFRESMLFCMPAIGRWAMVIGCWGVVYPRSEGLAAQFIRTVTWPDILVATTVVGLGLWGMFDAVTAVLLMIAVCLVVRSVVWWMSKKFGGMTGDVLGAIDEGVEVLFLILGPVLLVISEFGE